MVNPLSTVIVAAARFASGDGTTRPTMVEGESAERVTVEPAAYADLIAAVMLLMMLIVVLAVLVLYFGRIARRSVRRKERAAAGRRKSDPWYAKPISLPESEDSESTTNSDG